MRITTSRPALARAGAAIGLLLVVACGGDTGPSQTQNGSMSAKIDNDNWSANVAIAATFSNGIVAIAGTDGQGRTIGFGAAATGPGTFTVAPTSPTNASVQIGSQGWFSSVAGGSGTLIFTTLTATEAKGSFQFTLVPVAGTGATGDKSVTQGLFDVKFP